MFDILHHHTMKIQLLAHSITSFCFMINCAEYTSYLSTNDLIAYFKTHSLVGSSQIYPSRSSRSSLLTSIYGSPSLKIPLPSYTPNRPLSAGTVLSTSASVASQSMGKHISFISSPKKYYAEVGTGSSMLAAPSASTLPMNSAVNVVPSASALGTVASAVTVPSSQPIYSASSMAPASSTMPSIPSMDLIGSPIPPSSNYQIQSPIPPSSNYQIQSPIPPSSNYQIQSPIPSSSNYQIQSPIPPSSSTLPSSHFSLPATSSLFTSMPIYFDSGSYTTSQELPPTSHTVRPSSAASDRPSTIAHSMSTSNVLFRTLSSVIPQMDISTGEVIPESISIPITALTPKNSPKPLEERKGIEDYLAFPAKISLDVQTLYSKFDLKNQTKINRSDFVSAVVSADPMKSSILSPFARDVYDALDSWREENVEISVLFGILTLFENSPFSDRCEVFSFFSYFISEISTHCTQRTERCKS